MMFFSKYLFPAFTAYSEAQIPITMRASVFPHAIDVGGSVVMQCAYTVDPHYHVTLRWYKSDGINHFLMWTADTSGHNATEDHFHNIYLESKYSLSDGHAIQMKNFHPDDKTYYYCTITISTPYYTARSNKIKVSKIGNDILLQYLTCIILRTFFTSITSTVPGVPSLSIRIIQENSSIINEKVKTYIDCHVQWNNLYLYATAVKIWRNDNVTSCQNTTVQGL